MNKIHTYKGYEFNIKVELNISDFGRPHMITLNDLGVSNYYEKQPSKTDNLEELIELMIESAEKWAENRINFGKSREELILTSLGFE